MTTPTTPAEAVSLPLVAEIWTCQGEIDACRDDGMLGAFDTDHTQGNDHFDIGYVRLETALARESALVAERDALKLEVAKLMRVAIGYSDIISNHCIAIQSAVIDADLVSPQSGLAWIRNTLCGPGLLTDLEEARALGGAQAWFDAKTAEEEARKAALAAPAVEG